MGRARAKLRRVLRRRIRRRPRGDERTDETQRGEARTRLRHHDLLLRVAHKGATLSPKLRHERNASPSALRKNATEAQQFAKNAVHGGKIRDWSRLLKRKCRELRIKCRAAALSDASPR